MPRIDAPTIPTEDRPFLARLCAYFGVPSVAVREANGPRHDISVQPNPDAPVILVGPKWHRRRQRSAIDGRLALTHEFIHVAGYPHSPAMRQQGYYSVDHERDKLSQRVLKDVLAGTPHFDPQRFGLTGASVR